jgi:hypothetical protein
LHGQTCIFSSSINKKNFSNLPSVLTTGIMPLVWVIYIYLSLFTAEDLIRRYLKLACCLTYQYWIVVIYSLSPCECILLVCHNIIAHHILMPGTEVLFNSSHVNNHSLLSDKPFFPQFDLLLEEFEKTILQCILYF